MKLLQAENLLLRIEQICTASEYLEGDGVSLEDQKSYIYWGLYNDNKHLLDDIREFLGLSKTKT